MKKLIIIAQPSSKWFTHEIVSTYKKTSESYNDEVDVLDLYEKKNFQPNLEFEDMKILWIDPNREKFQQKILWADELVFVFPIWWGYMPAIMKNFIDTNFSAGFAYKFQKWKTVPKKLLEWRTAKVFATCDGFKYMYNNMLCPMYIEAYLRHYIFWVFGIELVDFELFSKMRKKTPEEKEEMLRKIELDLKAEKVKHGFRDTIHDILKI